MHYLQVLQRSKAKNTILFLEDWNSFLVSGDSTLIHPVAGGSLKLSNVALGDFDFNPYLSGAFNKPVGPSPRPPSYGPPSPPTSYAPAPSSSYAPAPAPSYAPPSPSYEPPPPPPSYAPAPSYQPSQQPYVPSPQPNLPEQFPQKPFPTKPTPPYTPSFPSNPSPPSTSFPLTNPDAPAGGYGSSGGGVPGISYPEYQPPSQNAERVPCTQPGHTCVAKHLCVDGRVNSNGVGIIQLRISV
ncbi:vegetative cell wall protein gp1-like, partial [Diaphorina citri]|uniref:Vegetative cell wall protein gp1-like n=1 Tax=Diaphorina citri TaxID=121845 RepID=A0A3Q0JCJ1_DIACI